jgi:hypothetical protein
MNVCNKLDCLFLVSLSNLVLCLGLRQGAYPRVKSYTRLEESDRAKHSSLFVGGISDKFKKFDNTETWTQ